MNTSSTTVNLREAIKKLDSLPALPSIAQKLLTLDASSEAGIHDSDWEALGISPEQAEEILLQAAGQADQAALFAANLG